MSGFCLILLTVLFAFSQERAQGSIIVNTLTDHDDGICDAADCTLREAVKYAPAGATITFSVTGTIQLTQRELGIAKDLTIAGPGAGRPDDDQPDCRLQLCKSERHHRSGDIAEAELYGHRHIGAAKRINVCRHSAADESIYL